MNDRNSAKVYAPVTPRRSVTWGLLTLVAIAMNARSAAAQPYLYVVGRVGGVLTTHLVTRVDLATGALQPPITAGLGYGLVPIPTIAAAPDGRTVFVVNQRSATLTAISTATNTVAFTMPTTYTSGGGIVRGGPDDSRTVYVHPDSGTVYLTDRAGLITAYDVATRTMSRESGGGGPVIHYSSGGTRMHLGVRGGIQTLDARSLAPISLLPISFGQAAFAPNGQRVYVVDPSGNRLLVYDFASGAVLATVTGPGVVMTSPTMSPNGRELYVLEGNRDRIHVFDTASNTFTAEILGTSRVQQVQFSADGRSAYALGYSPPAVYLIPTAARTVAATLPLDTAVVGDPINIAVATAPSVPPPEPPTALRASTVLGNRVTLDWSASPSAGIVGYVVEGGVSSGQVLGSVPTGSAVTRFTLDAPTGTFFVRVHAVGASGRSAASNEIQIAVNTPSPPSAPTGLLGLADGSTLQLVWNAGSGGPATGHILDVSGAFAGSLPIGPGARFTFGGVSPGSYTFAVRAQNASGASAPSAPVTLTFPGACAGAPQAPAGLLATRAGSIVAVSWDLPAAGTAPTFYVLHVTGAFVGSLALPDRSISAAVPPGTYTFIVRAANACGQSQDVGPQSVTVP